MSNDIGKRILDNLTKRSDFNALLEGMDVSLREELLEYAKQLVKPQVVIENNPEEFTDDTFKIIPSEVFDRAHEDILGFNDHEYIQIDVMVMAIDTEGKSTVGWVSHFDDGSSFGNTSTTDQLSKHSKTRSLFNNIVEEMAKIKIDE